MAFFFVSVAVTYAVRFVRSVQFSWSVCTNIGYVYKKKSRYSVSGSSQHPTHIALDNVPSKRSKKITRKLWKQHTSICLNEKPHTYAKRKQRARFSFTPPLPIFWESFLLHVLFLLIATFCSIFVYVIYRILSRKFNFIRYFHLRLAGKPCSFWFVCPRIIGIPLKPSKSNQIKEML